MEIISDTEKIRLPEECAVVIGKFDGMHIGHRKLLDHILEPSHRLIQVTAKKKLAACVFTFDPPPSVLFGYSDGKELTTREEKRVLFQRMGVDFLIEFPLNSKTAAMPPEEFVEEILVNGLNTRYLAAGNDLSFGAGGAGNVGLLQKMADASGFTMEVIDKVLYREEIVSSTRIRRKIEEGKMEEAEEMLGTPYTIHGIVEHGNRMGRTMGMPTVNLCPKSNKLLPPHGVYYSTLRYKGKYFPAISNVGIKPTVANRNNKKEVFTGVESYIYDFHEEIYGAKIEVGLHTFCRSEKKFEGLDALREQLEKDIREGRKWHLAKKNVL